MSGFPDDYRAPARMGAALFALGVGVFSAWAAFAPLSEGVVARGRVESGGGTREVNHPGGGVVETVHVRDGDSVAAGDPILTLDDTKAVADAARLKTRLGRALARRERLLAEIGDAPELVYSSALKRRAEENGAVREAMKRQRGLFEARRDEFQSDLAVLEDRIAQTEARIDGLERQIAAKREQVELLESEIDSVSGLASQGHAPANEAVRLKRERAALDAEVGALRTETASERRRLAELRSRIRKSRAKRRREVEVALEEVEGQVADFRERVATVEQKLRRTVVRSPVDGRVVDMRARTEGASVSAGKRIARVVPEPAELSVVARVAPGDRDGLEPGMSARIRFSAFSQSATSPVEGKVSMVGGDVVRPNEKSNPHYKVRVRVPEGDLNGVDRESLVPGMPAEVIIQKDSRTFLDYLAGPVADTFSRAMRE